jgi:hypothetical protein
MPASLVCKNKENNMKLKSTLCAIMAACILSAPAFANGDAAHKDSHHAMHGKMMHHHGPFEMVDANHDGTVTKAEADAYFDKVDANHDGKITREEHMNYMKGAHEKMTKKMREMCMEKDMKKPCCKHGMSSAGHGADFSTLNK